MTPVNPSLDNQQSDVLSCIQKYFMQNVSLCVFYHVQWFCINCVNVSCKQWRNVQCDTFTEVRKPFSSGLEPRNFLALW